MARFKFYYLRYWFLKPPVRSRRLSRVLRRLRITSEMIQFTRPPTQFSQ
jgi:hypothetical protein